ncbi:hypothetical protein J2W68_003325 [Luteimonas terrae]|uniref:IS110 family transposase n=1 Tax=Luteimonas terrae TaxID=1530191 RepID=A0ABU1Y0M7_9GAMM|nr:hypothetical protein [Luteimonas terrae]
MTAVEIDVGKAALDVVIDGASGVTRFANSAAGIRKLVRRLQGIGDARVVVEPRAATGTRCLKPAAMPVCGCRGSIREARDFARETE